VWLSVWLRCTGGHHPLLLFGGAPPLSFLIVASLKSMFPVQQRLPLQVLHRWDACATSRIAFTKQPVGPQANVSNADSYKKLTDAHPSVTVRAYPEIGGVLQKWSGCCMLYRPLLPVAQRTGILQVLPHLFAAHSNTHALSSSAERLPCHFIVRALTVLIAKLPGAVAEASEHVARGGRSRGHRHH